MWHLSSLHLCDIYHCYFNVVFLLLPCGICYRCIYVAFLSLHLCGIYYRLIYVPFIIAVSMCHLLLLLPCDIYNRYFHVPCYRWERSHHDYYLFHWKVRKRQRSGIDATKNHTLPRTPYEISISFCGVCLHHFQNQRHIYHEFTIINITSITQSLIHFKICSNRLLIYSLRLLRFYILTWPKISLYVDHKLYHQPQLLNPVCCHHRWHFHFRNAPYDLLYSRNAKSVFWVKVF